MPAERQPNDNVRFRMFRLARISSLVCSRLLIVAVLAFGLLLGLPAGSGATFAGRNGVIAVTVYPSAATHGKGGLWSIDPASQKLKLIWNACLEYTGGMTYSPHGRRIAHVTACRNAGLPLEFAQIFTMNSDGTGRRLLATADLLSVPIWSPDGRWIAYTAYTDRVTQRTIVDSNSGRVLRTFPWHGPIDNTRMSWGTDNRIRVGCTRYAQTGPVHRH